MLIGEPMRRKNYSILFVIIIFSLGFIAGSNLYPRIIEKEVFTYLPSNISAAEGRTVEMKIPAVDANGNGVTGNLRTTVRPGTGLVLVSINDVLAQFDTQISGRVAAKAASNYTGISLEKLDVIYFIEVNADTIEGPSAGASMTISIVADLLNKSLNHSVAITGTIREDGSIGPVGAIIEKAKASRDAGANILLVPDGQGFEPNVTRQRSCKFDGKIEYCKVDYINKRKNLGDSIGIELVEVSDIKEALNYFLMN
jgi:uncharacterized protein